MPTKAATSVLSRRVIVNRPHISEDNTARVWDAASGRSLAVLQGHTDSVTSAVFSPDGQRVVTASADKTARVWRSFLGTKRGSAFSTGTATRMVLKAVSEV